MRKNYQKVRQLIEAKIFQISDLALYQSTAPVRLDLPHYVNTIHIFSHLSNAGLNLTRTLLKSRLKFIQFY